MFLALRNRWFWVSVVLSLANITGGALWWRSTHNGRSPTRIVRVTPEVLASPEDPLQVLFSRPMVKEAGPAAAFDLSWARITPAVPLRARWTSRSTLELRPQSSFPRATPFELTLSGRILDEAGEPIALDRAHRFQTRSVEVVEVSQAALSRDWEATIRVQFSEPVPLEGLEKSIRFEDEKGLPVAMVRTTGGDSAREVLFRSDARPRELIAASINAGLKGISGPLGLERAVRRVVTLESGLRLQEATASIRDLGDAWVFLRFGLPVDARVAKDFISVEPQVRYELEGDGQGNGDGLSLRGDFQPGRRYRVRLRAGLPAEGGRFLPDAQVRTLDFPELMPSVLFLGDGRFLVEKGSQSLLVRSVNVEKILIGAERLFPNNLVYSLEGRGIGTARLPELQPIPVTAPRNQPAFTRIDLRQLLGEGALGEGPRGLFRLTLQNPDRWWGGAEKTVTITDLGLHVKYSPRGFVAWVIRLSDLSPVGGAEVVVLSRKNQELLRGTTGPDGVARLEDAPREDLGEPYVVTVASGEDAAYLPLEEGRLAIGDFETGGRPYAATSLEAFLHAERGVVRPGEAIHARAIVRDLSGEAPPALMPVVWEVRGASQKLIFSQPAVTSDLGTCELEWRSQPASATGAYRVTLRVPGEARGEMPRAGGEEGAESLLHLGETDFRVEEFIPETLRVQLAAPERRFAGGETLSVEVRAEHLSGGAASGLAVKGRLELRPESFTLAAHAGVSFWSSNGDFTERTIPSEPVELDAEGKAKLDFAIPAGLRARSALRAFVTVNVIEVGGRAATARLARPVDPLPFYLAVRHEAGRWKARERRELSLLAVRPDGAPAPLEKIEGRASRITWSHRLAKDEKSGHYHWRSDRVETPAATFTVRLESGAGTAPFAPELSGEYQIVFTAANLGDLPPAEARATIFVEGTGGEPADASLERPARIALTPEKGRYRVGETARIRVESPFAGAALLTTETDRVHAVRTFRLESAGTTIEVPVTADLRPHGYVTLTVVRGASRSDGKGVPLRAYGAAPLLPDPDERRAEVTIDLPAEARPGEELHLDLRLRKADGTPEEGELSVALVDAGILSLTGFRTPDPLEFFAAQRALGTRGADLYSLIIPEPAELIARAGLAPGGGDDGSRDLSPVLANRVKSVSLWRSGLRAGADGKVSLSLPAPDFDGELVAIAVAAGKTSLGSARRALKVHHPIILEPGLPRFLAPGDSILAPLAIRNTTDREATGQVSVMTTPGILSIEEAEPQPALARSGDQAPDDMAAAALVLASLHVGPAPRAVTLPPGGRTTLWYPLRALEVGKGEVEFIWSDGAETIQRRTEIPVRPAAAAESLWETFLLESTKALTLRAPEGYLPSTLKGELILSPRILPAMEGSLRALLHYPYGCVEQTTSTLIPWIALRDYLKATGDDAYSDSEIADHVQAGVARLFSMQTGDGGLAYWPGGERSYSYGSLHAATILLEARSAGYELPPRPLERLLDFIDGLLAHPGDRNQRDGDAVEDVPARSASLRALALSILARAGRPRPAWIETLYERRDDLLLEGRAHLAIAAAFSKVSLPGPLLDRDRVQAMADDEKEGRRDLAGYLYSRPREMSYVLGALIELKEPLENLLPLLTSLLARRDGGRFRSTLEDGLFVLALGKFAKLLPPPAGPVRVTLRFSSGETRAFEVKDRLAVPLSGAESSGTIELTLEGSGTIHVFRETRGVPLAPTARSGGAVNRGLRVRRVFLLPNGDPRPVGPFRQGEPLLVEIALDCAGPLRNVAVVDPLPAGLEIENPDLSSADGRRDHDPRFRLQKYEIRDDRLILFVDPPAGESRFRYLARAVTRGHFVLPAVAAECMYDSSIRGASGSGSVDVVK